MPKNGANIVIGIKANIDEFISDINKASNIVENSKMSPDFSEAIKEFKEFSELTKKELEQIKKKLNMKPSFDKSEIEGMKKQLETMWNGFATMFKNINPSSAFSDVGDVKAQFNTLESGIGSATKSAGELKSTLQDAMDITPEVKKSLAEIDKLKKEISATKAELNALETTSAEIRSLRNKEYKNTDEADTKHYTNKDFAGDAYEDRYYELLDELTAGVTKAKELESQLKSIGAGNANYNDVNKQFIETLSIIERLHAELQTQMDAYEEYYSKHGGNYADVDYQDFDDANYYINQKRLDRNNYISQLRSEVSQKEKILSDHEAFIAKHQAKVTAPATSPQKTSGGGSVPPTNIPVEMHITTTDEELMSEANEVIKRLKGKIDNIPVDVKATITEVDKTALEGLSVDVAVSDSDNDESTTSNTAKDIEQEEKRYQKLYEDMVQAVYKDMFDRLAVEEKERLKQEEATRKLEAALAEKARQQEARLAEQERQKQERARKALENKIVPSKKLEDLRLDFGAVNNLELDSKQVTILESVKSRFVEIEAIKERISKIDLLSEDAFDDLAAARSEVQEHMAYIKNAMKVAQNDVVEIDISNITEATEAFKRLAKEEKVAFDSSEIVDNRWIGKIKMASGEVKTVTYTFDELTNSISRTENISKKAASSLQEFMVSMGRKWKEVARYFLSFGSIYEVINLLRTGLNTLREMDAAMVEVRKVSNETVDTYAEFEDKISGIAKEIASTNVELRNSAADWLRLGESIEDASELAKNSAVYVNVGDGIDIDTATSDMITAMRAFNIEAKDSIKIVDAQNEVGNNFSISSGGIGEVMERSASALAVANNTFAESIALGTAMNESLQNTETAGSALKIFSLRIRGVKTEIEAMGESTDGMASSTSKLREQIKALTNVDGFGGYDIMTADGDFKSTAEIAKGLGQAFEQMGDVERAGLLELVAGKNRANAVASLLENWRTIDEVVKSVEESEGSAMRENAALVDSLNGRIKILSATAEEFWTKSTDQEGIKNFISLLTVLLEGLTAVVDKTGLFTTAISTIGGSYMAYKGIGITNVYALHGGNSMSYQLSNCGEALTTLSLQRNPNG